MERSAPAAAATYIEDRLRRRGRGDSQQDDLPASSSQVLADGEEGGSGAGSSSSGARGAGPGGDAGHFAMLQHRPALFGSEGAALVSAGGRQLTQWKESLLKKLKKVGWQPGLPQGCLAWFGCQQSPAAAAAGWHTHSSIYNRQLPCLGAAGGQPTSAGAASRSFNQPATAGPGSSGICARRGQRGSWRQCQQSHAAGAARRAAADVWRRRPQGRLRRVLSEPPIQPLAVLYLCVLTF